MTDTLPSAIEAIPDGGDPFVVGAKWFGLIVAALLVGAAPVMLYLRKYHVDHLANARDAANAEVFETLRQQIRDHGEQLHRATDECARQQLEVAALRMRVVELEANEAVLQRLKKQLEDTEALNTRLKEKMDHKDVSIDQLSMENRQLVAEVFSLKDRVHELELRLAKDEAAWCKNCDLNDSERCPRPRPVAGPVTAEARV